MSYYRNTPEEPLKTSQKVNKLQIPNSSYLKSFKKVIGSTSLNKSKIESRASAGDENSYSKDFRDRNERNDRDSRGDRDNKNSRGREQKDRDRGDGDKKRQLQQLHSMMQETDNSMEELLNSSINHFEKLIINEEIGESLEQQNSRLKNALAVMKTILKQKLQSALQKQKDELSKMLEDYTSLITKLLQDKEHLTIKIQDLMESTSKRTKQLELQWGQDMRKKMHEKDYVIEQARNSLEEFARLIESYEEEAKVDAERYSAMEDKVQELQGERDQWQKEREQWEKERDSMIQGSRVINNQAYDSDINESQYSQRIDAQSTKIQTLLELLQKSEAQNNQLKQQLQQSASGAGSGSMDSSYLRAQFQKKLREIEQEHEQQFLEYEKAIKDTIAKKDECIQRLNIIIEGLRERKGV